jgi:NitT/TauT family transport system substrate-binding protein
MFMARSLVRLLFLMVPLSAYVLFSIGCKKETTNSGTAGKIRIQLDWHPEPQFGGTGTPTYTMVAAGSTEFGITSADSIVVGREQGMDLVALFATYQTFPQGIMTHADRGFSDLGEVFRSEGVVALEEGKPYARYLKGRITPFKAKIVPSPGGSIAAFLSDPKMSQQCFVTAEPFTARRANARVKTFLVAETGYNPYTTVLIAKGDYVRKNPEVAKRLVAAVREGWEAYLADPKPANELMRKLNPGMDEQTFIESAQAQVDLILTPEAKSSGLGSMTKERWETLCRQLVEAGVVKSPPAADQCYVDVSKLP